MLLNIGTGSNPQTETIAGTKNTPSRFRYFSLLRNAVRKWDDGRDVPSDFRRMVAIGNQPMDYHRLDVQEGLQHIRMDEWKKDGSTLLEIERYTRLYLSSAEAQTILEIAAKQLVDARKEREYLWSEDKKAVIT
jgi:hypothetical protein